ncbi:MAG: 2-oxo acid dehydrogenase subunit E2 [Chloroflexota bacterium]
MPIKVVMPEMGEGVTEATIIRWLKNEGDTVEQYEALVEVNTDKVDSEIPSPEAGTILKITQAPDALVDVNQTLCWIGEPGEDIPEEDGDVPAAAPVTKAPEPGEIPVVAPAPVIASHVVLNSASTGTSRIGVVSPLAAKVAASHGVDPRNVSGTGNGGEVTKDDVLKFIQSGGSVGARKASVAAANGNMQRNSFISPLVARLSGEHGIDLTNVTGTGKDQRITKKDINRVIEAGGQDPLTAGARAPSADSFPAAIAPLPAFSGMQAGTVMKHTPVRRSIAKHMLESKRTSPHVTTIMEADLSNVSVHRTANKAIFAKDGAKLTFTAYFVSAVISALKAYPLVNSSWSDDGVNLHKDINVGIAVSLDADGLIVPVIKNADGLSLLGISRAINELAGRARGKKLKPTDVRGGTFTITNHGTSGSLFATPVINQPQCGILGTGAIQKRAVVINDAIAIRPMVYIGLTFDHRILDGAIADYFLGTIKKVLEDWQ